MSNRIHPDIRKYLQCLKSVEFMMPTSYGITFTMFAPHWLMPRFFMYTVLGSKSSISLY